MCGRFTYKYTWKEIHDRLSAFLGDIKAGRGVVEHPTRFNITPTQPVIVVLNDAEQNKAELMRWGLVPNWVKDPRDFPLIINARAETILEKPSFRGALRHHRCIIPASGYYEWRTDSEGKKQPYYITLKDGAPMAFASVKASWMGPDGEEIDSAAIVTVPASKDLQEVHHRMPVMLEGDQISNWLNMNEVSEKDAHQMLKPLQEGKTNFHPVSTRVNAARDDDENLIEEVTIEKTNSEKMPKPKKKRSGQMDLF